MLYNILVIDIYGSHNVMTIFRLLFRHRHPRTRHHPLDTFPHLPLQFIFKRSFQPHTPLASSFH